MPYDQSGHGVRTTGIHISNLAKSYLFHHLECPSPHRFCSPALGCAQVFMHLNEVDFLTKNLFGSLLEKRCRYSIVVAGEREAGITGPLVKS